MTVVRPATVHRSLNGHGPLSRSPEAPIRRAPSCRRALHRSTLSPPTLSPSGIALSLVPSSLRPPRAVYCSLARHRGRGEGGRGGRIREEPVVDQRQCQSRTRDESACGTTDRTIVSHKPSARFLFFLPRYHSLSLSLSLVRSTIVLSISRLSPSILRLLLLLLFSSSNRILNFSSSPHLRDFFETLSRHEIISPRLSFLDLYINTSILQHTYIFQIYVCG